MLVEAARPRVIRDHPQAGWLAVATVCFGAFMGQLDASIVTLTFPALEDSFSAPLAAVQWVSLCYLLTLVGVITAAGRLADAFGRKLFYLYGFLVFTGASAACGLAGSLAVLIGFRVVQALGAAMLQANSVALVVTSVRPDQVRAGLGVQAAAQALGLAMGPALGGVLVAEFGWRSVFWVNVPIGVVALVAGRYLLPRTRNKHPIGVFDWLGLGLLALTSTAALLALSALSGLTMPAWLSLALSLIALLALAGFVVRLRRARSPLVRPSVLAKLPVAAGLAGALCGYLVLFGPLALFPQAGTVAPLALTALPLGFAVAAVFGGGRGSARVRALAGGLVAACAAGLLIPWPSAVWLALLGLGLGVFIPANNAAVMAAIPADMAATGGGLVNMTRGLGTALGVAAVTLSLHVAGTPLALSALAVVALLAAATGVAAR
ncbi:MFS transporter [Labedaea rhizosphaerae]|uniref:MFS transporter n=1 Tax=Labedaea rhizosphaerae TaxID=598644 RepID=A0A4R6SAK6_LABRH|nr:MFS transporter [Labedaea rhizosphaerae]TDP97059.1 MFS transporter [Labedaea rhizosphaerae]